jgi:hypothetical protein
MIKIFMDAKLRKIDFRSNLVILIKKNLLGTKNAL